MNSKKITSLLVAKKKDINKKIKKVIGVMHMHHCLARGIKWEKRRKKYKQFF